MAKLQAIVKKCSLTVFLPILITALFFEGLLWLTPFIQTKTTNRITSYLNHDWPYTSQGWALRYLKSDVALQESNLYQPHPTRGWTFKPNLSFWMDGYQWTINEFGHRSLHTPNKDSQAFKVYVVGDSQTAGDEVDDIHVWPNQLQSRVPNVEIVNAAVSGYSLSQMIISAIEDYPSWEPDLIVLSVIEDDLYRSALEFRTAPMPIIKLNPLEIQAAISADKQEVQNQYFSTLNLWLRHFKTVQLFTSLKDRYLSFPKNKQKAYQINHALLNQLLQSVGDETKIIFAYLPYPYELAGQASNTMFSQYQQLCQEFESEKFSCQNVGEYMTKDLGDYRQGGGHYHRKGNQTVAIAMENYIRTQLEQDADA